jgi:hypothetical protein
MDLKLIGRHIRALASMPATKAPVLSCHVDLEDPRWRSRFDEQAETLRAAFPPGEGRRWFEQALRPVKDHLRRPVAVGVRGLALFSRGGTHPFFVPLCFRIPLPAGLEIGRFPHVYRLAALRDNFHRFAALVVTSDAVRILGVNTGAVTQHICDRRIARLSKGPSRSGMGELRMILADAAAILEPFMRLGGYRHLMLAGDAARIALLRQALPRHLAARIWDIIPANDGDALMDIVQAASFSFADREEEESAAMVEWLCEGLGRDGWAVAGAGAALQAVKDGTADILILDERFIPEPVRQCVDCGRFSPPASPQFLCPICGTGLCLPRDEREALVRAAVFAGVHIEIVNHSDALMRLGGVGCILRSAPEQQIFEHHRLRKAG